MTAEIIIFKKPHTHTHREQNDCEEKVKEISPHVEHLNNRRPIRNKGRGGNHQRQHKKHFSELRDMSLQHEKAAHHSGRQKIYMLIVKFQNKAKEKRSKPFRGKHNE